MLRSGSLAEGFPLTPVFDEHDVGEGLFLSFPLWVGPQIKNLLFVGVGVVGTFRVIRIKLILLVIIIPSKLTKLPIRLVFLLV